MLNSFRHSIVTLSFKANFVLPLPFTLISFGVMVKKLLSSKRSTSGSSSMSIIKLKVALVFVKPVTVLSLFLIWYKDKQEQNNENTDETDSVQEA